MSDNVEFQLSDIAAREAADEAFERADQLRVDWLAVQGTDEELAAYNRWQRAVEDFRTAAA
jgi:hypothetical protein